MFKRLEYLETVNSTNEYLKRFVEEGVGRAVLAHQQTAGKGQYGRSWYSPPGEGLYASYLFYPDWEVERSPFLNMMAALAAARTLQARLGSLSRVKIKPPNDLLIKGKKVCGILVELSSLPGRISWSVVGIGVNLKQKNFPAELADEATSLALEGVAAPQPLDFFAQLTRELEAVYGRLEQGDWQSVQDEYEHF